VTAVTRRGTSSGAPEPAPEEAAEPSRGLVHTTVDAFVDSTRAVVEAMASAGSGALGALPARSPGC
jgi:hypothetical protein